MNKEEKIRLFNVVTGATLFCLVVIGSIFEPTKESVGSGDFKLKESYYLNKFSSDMLQSSFCKDLVLRKTTDCSQ